MSLTGFMWVCGIGVLSISFAYLGYLFPRNFTEISEVIATITTVLLAVSLTISAVVATPFKARSEYFDGDGGSKRIESALAEKEQEVLAAQSILFFCYAATLLIALALLWFSASNWNSVWFPTVERLVSAALGFMFAASFAMSLRLPALLQSVVSVRRELGAQ